MAKGALADAMVPYEPLNVPKPFGADAWIVDGPEIRMDYGPVRMPFPTRMTVVRLASGELWVHSPIAPDEGLFAAIHALGPVRHLIAPNSLHYWYMADWNGRYPAAVTYAAPGLAEKAKRPFRVDHVLDDALTNPWEGEIDWLLVPGSVVNEVVFHIRRARLLVLTDLIENFELPRVRSRVFRWMIALGRANGSTPADLRLTFRRQRHEVARRLGRVIDWRPERIVMAHGAPIDTAVEAALERAFAWARPERANR